MSEPLTVTSSLVIPAAELRWTAIRASGPGGQNVNKVASKVVLRFDVKNSRVLDGGTKARLVALAGSRVDTDGSLTIVSQATRDQPKNLEDARQKLADLVRRALERPKRRKATRPSSSARRKRLEHKRRVGDKKRERSSREE